MIKIKSKQIGLFIGDALLFAISVYFALYFRTLTFPSQDVFISHLEILSPIFVVLVASYFSFGFYDLLTFQNRLQQLSKLINVHLFLAVIGFVYFYLFSPLLPIAPKTILILYTIVGTLFAIIWHIFTIPSFLSPSSKIKTLLIADNEEYDELKNAVNSNNYYPFYFVSHLSVVDKDLSHEENAISKLKHVLDENNISQVVVDIRDQRTNIILPYLYNLASQRKINVFDAASVYQDILKKMPMRGVGHFWFFEHVNLDIQAYEATKRVMDIILAIPWFIFWMILHPFVYLAIRFDSKGDVFITQERYGFGGKIIKLYKYRTMTFSDKGKWLKEKDNENKVTRVGYFLRKSRIDELPQLLSILNGDISFIGPRPDILALGGQLSATIPFYMMRYTVKPGLSGWAQVNQNLPPQSVEETKVRLQYDLFYVKNRSLLLDLIVMIRTFKVLISRSGM